jgi:hypothetical protein
MSVQGVPDGGNARYPGCLFCPATGKLSSNLAPVPDRVAIGHDVPVGALTSAGLRLDDGTVRLERTTEAGLIAGSRLREEVRASIGRFLRASSKSARPRCPGSYPSRSWTWLRVWPRQTAWLPSPRAWSPHGGSTTGMRTTTEGTSAYLRTARCTGSRTSTSSSTMAHNGGGTSASSSVSGNLDYYENQQLLIATRDAGGARRPAPEPAPDTRGL